ncbi:MAG: hypothetical protein ACOC4C_03445 [Fibrobacterota bacterium]
MKCLKCEDCISKRENYGSDERPLCFRCWNALKSTRDHTDTPGIFKIIGKVLIAIIHVDDYALVSRKAWPSNNHVKTRFRLRFPSEIVLLAALFSLRSHYQESLRNTHDPQMAMLIAVAFGLGTYAAYLGLFLSLKYNITITRFTFFVNADEYDGKSIWSRTHKLFTIGVFTFCLMFQHPIFIEWYVRIAMFIAGLFGA